MKERYLGWRSKKSCLWTKKIIIVVFGAIVMTAVHTQHTRSSSEHRNQARCLGPPLLKSQETLSGGSGYSTCTTLESKQSNGEKWETYVTRQRTAHHQSIKPQGQQQKTNPKAPLKDKEQCLWSVHTYSKQKKTKKLNQSQTPKLILAILRSLNHQTQRRK